MKHSIEWHRQCLFNATASYLEKCALLKRVQDDVRRAEDSLACYTQAANQ
jgi:hypothetical protein